MSPLGSADLSRSDSDVPRYQLERDNLGWKTTIPFVFTNTATSAVFVDHCNRWTGASFEKLVEGEWVFAVGVGRPDCLSPLITVESGKTFAVDVPFFAAYPDNEVEPKLSVAGGVEGRYRIVLHGVYGSVDNATYPYGPEIPKERRASAAFELVDGG